MDEILLALMEHIKTNLPELSYIDEDYGQLESQEDSYPVTFPCVLIEYSNTDWEEVTSTVQTGNTSISFKLCLDCYDDTHYGSGTEDKLKERFEFNNKLYRCLQNLTVTNTMEPLTRVKSRNYTFGGGIKIYETIFQFCCHDESAR